ncbi:hypothetical protein PYCC9005_000007 [Savitreella phatthalungensis]
MPSKNNPNKPKIQMSNRVKARRQASSTTRPRYASKPAPRATGGIIHGRVESKKVAQKKERADRLRKRRLGQAIDVVMTDQ